MARSIASSLDRLERVAGMPARHAAPALLGGLALQVAVLGMYWDVGYHVDHGRDQAVLTVPHLLIVLGLQGIVFAALLHGILRGEGGRGDRRIRALRLRLSPGGVVMLVCGSVALIGFPLDAIWHALFGEDVTLWGPTHLLMIGGAGLSTLGLWMVVRQGLEVGRPRRTARRIHARVTGALLIGLSTFQAEFDFGVPQFQLLFQPVLIALAAACALVCARSLLGPWGAFQALAMFLVIRGALALFVGVAVGYTTPRFPLYVAEAAVVEVAALVFARRPLAFALAAGAGIGTVGLRGRVGVEPRLDGASVAGVDARRRTAARARRRRRRRRARGADQPVARAPRQPAGGPRPDPRRPSWRRPPRRSSSRSRSRCRGRAATARAPRSSRIAPGPVRWTSR